MNDRVETETRSLFDAFYTRFILRDLFGKIVPGLLLVGATLVSIAGVESAGDTLENLGTVPWIALIGASWIVGFVVQEVGYSLRIIRYFSNTESDIQVSEEHRFRAVADSFEIQQFERFVVIKEATGNMCVSILIALSLTIADHLIGEGLAWFEDNLEASGPAFVVALAVAVFLFRMHRFMWTRQAHYMNAVFLHHGEQPVLTGTAESRQ